MTNETTDAQKGGALIDQDLERLTQTIKTHEQMLNTLAAEFGKTNKLLVDLSEAVSALVEAQEPDPTPEPEPEPEPDPTPQDKVPAYILTAAGERVRVSGNLSIDGPFSLCAFESDGVSGPVSFYIDGEHIRTESQGAFSLTGGNEEPFPLMQLEAGAYQLEVKAPGFDDLRFTLVVDGVEQPPIETPPVDQNAKPKIQVGLWYPASWNTEEPYINILHASGVEWSGADMRTQELFNRGFIDKVTGLPKSLPDGRTLTSGVYFTGRDMGHWDGEWVLEWDGDADLSMLYVPSDLMRKVGSNRIEFTRDHAGGRTPYHAAIQIKRLETLTGIRLFRLKNEGALRAGKIFNPATVYAASHYHIIRTMDLQETNRAAIRRVDDLATMDSLHWADIAYSPSPAVTPQRRSVPIEAMFALAREADTELWTHVPITLGAPVDIFDPSVFVDDFAGWAGRYRASAREHFDEVLESPEWDRYAEHFVKALIDSGYPADRALYVTLANEVWNFTGQYFLTTQYAWGIGEGSGLNGGYHRHGYGILSARWKLALDKALKDAGRDQKVIYVLEGQAVNKATTSDTLSAAKWYLEAVWEEWVEHAKDFAVSVASYWGSHDFTKAGIDPNDREALEQWMLNGPDTHLATKNAVVKYFKQHAAEAAKFGVPLLGAYEGGSHFNRPAEMSADAYQSFMWHGAGGRINEAVNDALVDAFPGIVLSNYVLAGPETDAWFEGPLNASNPYAQSWLKYQKGK